jgi:hypothetical protein
VQSARPDGYTIGLGSDTIGKTLADPATARRFIDIGAGLPKPERQGGAYMH